MKINRLTLDTNGNNRYAHVDTTSGDPGNTSNTTSGPNNNDNEGVNLNSSPSLESVTTTNEKVVIEFNGTAYNNNDVITVPYDKDNSHYAFLLKNYPKDDSLNWQVLYLGSDYTSKHVTNEPKYDNLGIDMKKVYSLDIVANYNDQKIKVTIKRELEDFNLVDIYAKPEDSPRRIAKTGKKLYLKGSATSLTKANRKLDFSVNISPNLSTGDISVQDIIWYYEKPNSQYNLGQNYGDKDIHISLTEQDKTYWVKAKAGNPESMEKAIEVVWFDTNRSTYNFLPPNVNALLSDTFKEIENNFDLMGKYIPIAGMKFKLDPIKTEGLKYNEEDPNSRLYKQYEQGSVKGGISAELKKIQITHPVLKVLSEVGIADVGLYVKIKAAIVAKGGVERFKYIEHTEFENNNPFLEIGPSGCIEAGVEAKLLVARDLVDFDVRGFAMGCLAGKIKYGFLSKKLEGELYIPPVVLGGKVKIETKGTLEYELIDWKSTISISDKIELGKIEKQF